MNKINTVPTPDSNTSNINYEKGSQFEDYIIKLFNAQFFRLNKHRKAQNKFGACPADWCNPDLEMDLVFSRRKYRFAVECKWRKEFRNGIITLQDHQIQNYISFQAKSAIPVFVAIGVGGEPASPEKLFVTPLNNISMHKYLYESDLIQYQRRPTRKLYYNVFQMRLF